MMCLDYTITLTWLRMQMMQSVIQFTIWLKLFKNWQMDFDKSQCEVLRTNFYCKARKQLIFNHGYVNSLSNTQWGGELLVRLNSLSLTPASTLHWGREMDFSNIVLAESNIGLMGNYHIYRMQMTNCKRIRLWQNAMNFIFLWWVRGDVKISLCPQVIVVSHYWYWWGMGEGVNNKIWTTEHRKTGNLPFLDIYVRVFPFQFSSLYIPREMDGLLPYFLARPELADLTGGALKVLY